MEIIKELENNNIIVKLKNKRLKKKLHKILMYTRYSVIHYKKYSSSMIYNNKYYKSYEEYDKKIEEYLSELTKDLQKFFKTKITLVAPAIWGNCVVVILNK